MKRFIKSSAVASGNAMELETIKKNDVRIKGVLKKICIFAVLLFMGSHIYGQNHRLYFGPGMGFDYGGIVGGKIEYLPVKNFGIYGGLGYNLLSVGWNVGATYKILPDKRISPNLMAFYGYNGVIIVDGASDCNMTSYGVTFGANMDIKIGHRGNKLSVGLFVPIRSQKFMDHYNSLKNDSYFELKNPLIPIAISVGFNFLF